MDWLRKLSPVSREGVERRLRLLEQEVDWLADRRQWATRLALRKFRNRHRGQRCFIIGNGPSLKKTDLGLLKNEVTFGMNRFYLLFPKLGFQSTYFVSVNKLVIEQCAADIAGLSMPRFLSWKAREYLPDAPDVMWLRSRRDPRFWESLTNGIWEGSTVTYVAMQLAFYMGFETVILVGVDHHFSTRGPAHKVVVSAGDDPDHFDPKYFGRGFRWQLPDLENSELAYHLARYHYASCGRQILDATVGGKLTIFPKVDYAQLFRGSV